MFPHTDCEARHTVDEGGAGVHSKASAQGGLEAVRRGMRVLHMSEAQSSIPAPLVSGVRAIECHIVVDP